jgi:hypothetical protein
VGVHTKPTDSSLADAMLTALKASGHMESIQAIHDHACKMGAKCDGADTDPEEHGESAADQAPGKSANFDPDNTLVAFGSAVKSLGDDMVGGYLVHYGTPETPDLTHLRDFFDQQTNFGNAVKSDVYFDHGQDPVFGVKALTHQAEIGRDNVGVWIKHQLNVRDEYEAAVLKLAKAGKLGWSSGTILHLIERKSIGRSHHILNWPLGLDASYTAEPAEFLNHVVPLKSIQASSLKSLLTEQSQGPDGRTDSAPEGAVGDEAKSATIPDDLLALGLMVKRKAGTL